VGTTEAGVSVVIACHGVGEPLPSCVRAYLREARAEDEIVAVVADREARVRELAASFPEVRVLHEAPRALTPRLWALGLALATRSLVRVTVGNCVPDVGWRAEIAAPHASGEVAAGGEIGPGAALRLRDWAILFLRYRSYLPPLSRRSVHDVPGDHANYTRDALQATRASWADEFWEWEINRELVARGRTMVMDPRLRARYEGGESAFRFFRQRFRHGVRFGRTRLAGARPSRRWILVATVFAPGAAFFGKIVRDVWRRPGYRGRLLLSLPWLVFFVTPWAVGEWIGACRGPLAPPVR
jgi:hypothetical protein